MKFVLGLGNPGAKYEHTRHNVGFDVVEACAAFFQVRLRKRCFRLYRQARIVQNGQIVHLVEPLTYMNNSGEVLSELPPVQADELLVVCDQMDLPQGMIRIRRGGSSAGHNGLKSLMEKLGTGDFVRVYVGIGRPESGVSVVDHVLGYEDSPLLKQGIASATQALCDLLNGSSVEEVMIAYNRRNRN